MTIQKVTLWSVLIGLAGVCGCPARAQTTVVTPNSVTLHWTASGDDSTIGRAFAYVVRIRKLPSTSWVTHLAMPVPGASGQRDSCRIYPLTPDTDYEFTLQPADEAGNVAPLVGVPLRIHTPALPPVDTTPPAPVQLAPPAAPIGVSRSGSSWLRPAALEAERWRLQPLAGAPK